MTRQREKRRNKFGRRKKENRCQVILVLDITPEVDRIHSHGQDYPPECRHNHCILVCYITHGIASLGINKYPSIYAERGFINCVSSCISLQSDPPSFLNLSVTRSIYTTYTTSAHDKQPHPSLSFSLSCYTFD